MGHIVLFLFHYSNKILLYPFLALFVFLFLFCFTIWIWDYVNPCFHFGLRNLVNLVAFMPMIVTPRSIFKKIASVHTLNFLKKIQMFVFTNLLWAMEINHNTSNCQYDNSKTMNIYHIHMQI
jgi:hypothetical protein